MQVQAPNLGEFMVTIGVTDREGNGGYTQIEHETAGVIAKAYGGGRSEWVAAVEAGSTISLKGGQGGRQSDIIPPPGVLILKNIRGSDGGAYVLVPFDDTEGQNRTNGNGGSSMLGSGAQWEEPTIFGPGGGRSGTITLAAISLLPGGNGRVIAWEYF
jgi:hypothetical protein